MFCSLLLLFAAAPAFATKPFATKRKHPSAAEPSLSGASGHPLCTSGEKCIGSSDDGTVRHVLNGKPEDTYCEKCWDSFRQRYPELQGESLVSPESPGEGTEEKDCDKDDFSVLVESLGQTWRRPRRRPRLEPEPDLAEPEPLLAPPAPPLWRAALAASTWVDSDDESV